MRPTLFTACLAASVPLAAAWPSWLFPDTDTLIVRRQGPSKTTAAAKTPPPESTNLNTAKPTPTGSDAPSGTGSSDSGSSGNSTDSAAPTHTEFDSRDPAGSVVMLTPAPIAPINLYKIGDYVTWGWNYTNLQAPPTAIDILVSCSTASETWTLTQNMTFATQGSFTWDTAEQATAAQSPLLVEMYTLVIYDADSSISATPVAGYLGTFEGFTFGMYTPQPYTPLSSWNCATCQNAAGGLTEMERRALGVAVGMSVVTVLTFTWFVTGLQGL